VAIHSYTVTSEEFVSSCRIPTYEAHLRSSDLRPVYLWEKRFLQHLQWSHPDRRWVLKSPDHVYGLEALFSVFPNALIVQTHRNPLEVVSSSIQLTEVLQGLYGKKDDCERLAEREARVLAAAMDRLIRFRDDHPELATRFVDVNYSELVAEPLAVVRRIYEQFNMPLTSGATERMRQLALSRSRYARTKTGTTSALIGGRDVPAQASLFNDYCRRFGVTCRSPG